MLRGCTVFRQMEEERLEQLRGLGERENPRHTNDCFNFDYN